MIVMEPQSATTDRLVRRRHGRMIAGALNFIGSHALYGRNWGAIEHYPNCDSLP